MLFFLNCVLLVYSLMLYNCFYDNTIISDWIAKQDILVIEKINFDIPEYQYIILYNWYILIICVILVILYFIFKIIFGFRT